MIILNHNNYVTTNKTPITDKTLTGKGKKTKQTNKLKKTKINSNTYLLHPNYETTTLSNMQRKHHVYYDQTGYMSLTSGTSTIIFALKILPCQHGLLW